MLTLGGGAGGGEGATLPAGWARAHLSGPQVGACSPWACRRGRERWRRNSLPCRAWGWGRSHCFPAGHTSCHCASNEVVTK